MQEEHKRAVTVTDQECDQVIEALRQAASGTDVAPAKRDSLSQLAERFDQAKKTSGLQQAAEVTTSTAKAQWAQVQPQLQKTAQAVSKNVGDRLRRKNQ
jgi:hypothetical protein